MAGPGFLSLAGIEKQSPRALVEEAGMSPQPGAVVWCRRSELPGRPEAFS